MLDEDLLILIFLHLPFHCEVSRSSNMWTFSPMNVSLVCRSWRSLVIARPILWASISIRVSEERDNEVTFSCPRILHLLRTWFQNSASAPLSVHICSLIQLDGDQSAIEDILDLIHSQGDRLDELFLKFEVLPEIRKPFGRGPLRFRCPPNATRFDVSYIDLGGSIVTERKKAALDLSAGSGSRLRELCVTPRVSLIHPLQALRLANLRVLRISTDISKDINDTYTLLSACSSLEILQLSVYRTTHLPPNPQHQSPATTLSGVRTLIIYDGNKKLVPTIFQRLHCPSLKTFVFGVFPSMFTHSIGSATDMLRALADFLARSSASLRVLTLTYQISELARDQTELHCECPRALENVLRLSPELQHIYLQGIPVDDQFFKELTFKFDLADDDPAMENEICPKLVSILVLRRSQREQQHFVVQAKSTEDMVESRWRCSTHLRTLEGISFDIRVEGIVEDLARIQKCLDEGLLFYRDFS